MTTQTGMDALDDYTERVKTAVSQISFIKTVGVYPEIPAGFDTPAVFFEVEGWDPSDDVVSGSAMSVELKCNLYLLREFAADQYGQKARNAAMFMTGWINGRPFGPATKPAEFTGVQESDWMKDGKAVSSHSVWCVSFSQVVGVGTDPFAPPEDAPLLKEIFVGFAPDIGKEHEADYERVYPR